MNLESYYKLNFSLIQFHKYSLTEIENMIPWERDVYVELPAEDAEAGMCGKLIKSMYGTRDAAQNWETAYTVFFMKHIGLQNLYLNYL